MIKKVFQWNTMQFEVEMEPCYATLWLIKTYPHKDGLYAPMVVHYNIGSILYKTPHVYQITINFTYFDDYDTNTEVLIKTFMDTVRLHMLTTPTITYY